MRVLALWIPLSFSNAQLAPASDPFVPFQKGVNLDVSTPSSGVWFKTTYNSMQMKAVAEAGFEAVRVFMPYQSMDTNHTQGQIDDALANGLSISVCMWGDGGWANNPTMGQKQIGEKWGQLATLWKHYPNKLVFELMNEPAGVGFPKTDAGAVNAMGIYNAAAQAIRDADPARPILIGTAGFNDAEWLDFVTEKYLTYTFSGKGFMSDPNMGVTMHFYQPNQGPHMWFAMNEGIIGDNDTAWQTPILNQIMYAVNWRKKIGANIPVVTTEWGCWMFKSRTDGTCKGCHAGDLEKWADRKSVV